MVNISVEFATIKGQMNKLQVYTQFTMEMAAIGERLKGRMMLRKTLHSEAPSTRAASISSSGMLIIFWRRKKMPELIMISGKIRPW
jgi:hypothetical protein